ncbi:MAG: carbon-nitrogen hydrolase family protein [Caulobacterales bacterium]|jgi:predicted amidohydrolase
MARMLRIGVAQLRSGVEPAANRAHAMPMIREAAAAGARIVFTPENTHRLDKDRPRMLAAVENEDLAAELKAWGRIAAEHGIWLSLGSMAVWAGEGRVYNRSVLFAPDGKPAALYDKINLFDVELGGGETYRESATVAPGTKAVLTEGPMGAKIGLTICYDLRFAGLFQALAVAGAEVIAVPAAFTRPTGEAHWETLLRARAIETGAYIVAAAQGGTHEDGRATWGHSLVIDPWGKIIAAKDDDLPGLCVANLDLDAVGAARDKIPAWQGGRGFTGP